MSEIILAIAIMCSTSSNMYYAQYQQGEQKHCVLEITTCIEKTKGSNLLNKFNKCLKKHKGITWHKELQDEN